MAIFVVFSKLPAAAMAIYPFIVIRNKAYKQDKVLIHHELIHFRQQLELLIIPFYILYVLHYLVNRFKYQSHHQAYLNIAFEREAYAKEGDFDYLKTRKIFSWTRWVNV